MSEPAPGAIRKRSVTIAGHRTSVSLEHAFWSALRDVAAERGLSVHGLIAEIDACRADQNLSSAIRVHLLSWFQFGRMRDFAAASAGERL